MKLFLAKAFLCVLGAACAGFLIWATITAPWLLWTWAVLLIIVLMMVALGIVFEGEDP